MDRFSDQATNTHSESSATPLNSRSDAASEPPLELISREIASEVKTGVACLDNATEKTTTGPIRQSGILFSLPREIRDEVYKWAFFPMAGTHTIRPQHLENTVDHGDIMKKLHVLYKVGMEDFDTDNDCYSEDNFGSDEDVDGEDDSNSGDRGDNTSVTNEDASDDKNRLINSLDKSAIDEEEEDHDCGDNIKTNTGKNSEAPLAEDLTAILKTCHQIFHEAVEVWRRLPQFYDSVRDLKIVQYDGYLKVEVRVCFDTLSDPSQWTVLQDLNITVSASPIDSPFMAVRHLFFDKTTQDRLYTFASVLAGPCSELKRLHIVPSYVHLGLSGRPVASRPWVREGLGIIQDLWSILNPFIRLPSRIAVTTQGQWEGYNGRKWYNEHQVNGLELYTGLCETGFVEIRKHFAGKQRPARDQQHQLWKVPNCFDHCGRQLRFDAGLEHEE